MSVYHSHTKQHELRTCEDKTSIKPKKYDRLPKFYGDNSNENAYESEVD